VWFDGIVPVSLEKEILTIGVPNSVAKEYVETRFQEVLERHLREQLGHGAALNIEIWGSSKAAAEESGKPY
jgi:chromosomal replication initiation ATPase DnaA